MNITTYDNAELNCKLRTLITDDGEVQFVGKDVATALGYARPADAIREHVESEDKGVCKIPTPGGRQETVIINESGLYSLILGSKLPAAKTFKHWVTHTVLPSIRKTGSYGTTLIDWMQMVIDQFRNGNRIFYELSSRVSSIENELKEVPPPNGAITLRTFAKNIRLYSKSRQPHTQAVAAMASYCGINVSESHAHEDEYSVCLARRIGDGKVIYVPYLTIAGQQLLYGFCNNSMQNYISQDIYKSNRNGHKAGDVKDPRYINLRLPGYCCYSYINPLYLEA